MSDEQIITISGNPILGRLSQQVDDLKAEIERLKERLEVWPVDIMTGEFNRAIELDEDCDGISCRDELIRLQDEKIEQLEAKLKLASEAIASLPEDAMDYAYGDNTRWPIRDELLSKLNSGDK